MKKILFLLLILALLGLGAGLPYLAAAWQDHAIEGAVETGQIDELQLVFSDSTIFDRIGLIFRSIDEDIHTEEVPLSLGEMTEDAIRYAAETTLGTFAKIEELDILAQPHDIYSLQKILIYDQEASALFSVVRIHSNGTPDWSFEMWLDDATGKAIAIEMDCEEDGQIFERHGYDYNAENGLDFLYRLNAFFTGELDVTSTYTLWEDADEMALITSPVADPEPGDTLFSYGVTSWSFTIMPQEYVPEALPAETVPSAAGD